MRLFELAYCCHVYSLESFDRSTTELRAATGPAVDLAKTFGPTGAAKTLYAIRPKTCSPWDEPIRRRLSLPVTGAGYRRHLIRIQNELNEAVSDLGQAGTAAALPELLGRPESSPIKVVDEHDWVCYTRGYNIPSADLIASRRDGRERRTCPPTNSLDQAAPQA
jgi:hypothetical protein